MSVIIESDGKKFEFRGEYARPGWKAWILSPDGIITTAELAWLMDAHHKGFGLSAILHLIPEVLEFGGIQFIKTGEVRMPVVGEWYISSRTNAVVYCSQPFKTSSFKAAILKPFEKKKDDTLSFRDYCHPHSSFTNQYVDGKCRFCVRLDPKPATEPPTTTYSILLSEETVTAIAKLGYVPQKIFKVLGEEKEIVNACKAALGGK